MPINPAEGIALMEALAKEAADLEGLAARCEDIARRSTSDLLPQWASHLHAKAAELQGIGAALRREIFGDEAE